MSEDAKPTDKPAEKAADKPADGAAPAAAPADDTSRVGRFITKYHTFLSSTMIGVAGLAATSIWQYRQSETAQKQADSQQRVAETQAENSWKIERADILSKNLATLASTGPGTVEQRYGVLLSLTRSNVLDPELAVSYALELGKDNPEDMQSVLANTMTKDYGRLSRAYSLSCDERFGTAPLKDICNDKLSGRSAAIGQLFSDDVEISLAGGVPGPMALLVDERNAQLNVQRMAALFAPVLADLYQRRQWDEITRFLAASTGAHLVGSLVLAAERTGEFVTDDEEKQLEQFHDAQTKWLVGYLGGKTCDAECKARMLDVMVSHYSEAEGSYDSAVLALLEGPRTQSAAAISHLHTRLLWCQLDDSDLTPLRDEVVIPAALHVVDTPGTDPAVRDAILSLVSLVPEPNLADVPGSVEWQAMIIAMDKAGEKYARVLAQRRVTATKVRLTPPPALKATNFCAAPEAPPVPDGTVVDPTALPTPP